MFKKFIYRKIFLEEDAKKILFYYQYDPKSMERVFVRIPNRSYSDLFHRMTQLSPEWESFRKAFHQHKDFSFLQTYTASKRMVHCALPENQPETKPATHQPPVLDHSPHDHLILDTKTNDTNRKKTTVNETEEIGLLVFKKQPLG